MARRRRDLSHSSCFFRSLLLFSFPLFSFFSVNLPKNPNLSDRSLWNGEREQCFIISLYLTSSTKLYLNRATERLHQPNDILGQTSEQDLDDTSNESRSGQIMDVVSFPLPPPSTLTPTPPAPARRSMPSTMTPAKPPCLTLPSTGNPASTPMYEQPPLGLTMGMTTGETLIPQMGCILGMGLAAHGPKRLKSRLAHQKTLTWLGAPFNGLGPRYQEQLLGPTPRSLKIHSKGYGPTVKALKPNYKVKIEAHLSSIPRSVYFISLSSPILFMLVYTASVGRGLHPSRRATSIDWIDSYHSRGLKENLIWESPTEKDWKKAQVDSKKILAQPHQSATQQPPFHLAGTTDDVLTLAIVFTAIISRNPPLHLIGLTEDILILAKRFRDLYFSFFPRSQIIDDFAKKAARSMTIGAPISMYYSVSF